MSINIFEKASREGLTFTTTRGELTVTDLWKLPVTSSTNRLNLNTIGMAIQKRLRENESNDSLVLTATVASKEDVLDSLRLDIIKHIINILQKENKAKEELVQKQHHKHFIENLIEQKKMQNYENMSLEALHEIHDSL